MTLQMYLLEHEGKNEKRVRNEERESVVIKLIRMGLNFADIQKATDLPIHRLEQLVKLNTEL